MDYCQDLTRGKRVMGIAALHPSYSLAIICTDLPDGRGLLDLSQDRAAKAAPRSVRERSKFVKRFKDDRAAQVPHGKI
jgi:hypothetical protein